MISGNILSAQPNLNTFIYPTIKFQIDLARFFSLFQHLIFNDRNTGKALYFKHFTLSIMCFSQQTYALNGIPFVPQKLRNFPAILEHRKIQTNPL